MNKKFKMLWLTGALFVGLGGCASTNSVVLPRHDGAYEIISTGETEVSAYQQAIKQANSTCQKMDKAYRVHDRQTRFQGSLSPQAVRLSRSLSTALSAATDKQVPSVASADDYKVTILITCV